ncbi:hypothetical protein [Paenibacillus arenilitoris]|uniref:Uncharacterized protein n=1 Tax=Paenibacillus arenilitoris TaxID=2772299 RepID=A0A927CS21_9BACL|nr:hypothetical protein [Paenibacillus arenilitoris]MBD2872445.1 hypothetical protein [Paenibacillus arenilitoris]
MNLNACAQGRQCRSRFMNLLVIVPLLLAALFAYQAGNSFEQTAGASRFHAAVRSAYSYSDRRNAKRKTPLPDNAIIHAFVHALYLRRLFATSLLQALRTTVPQRLREQVMAPIKFTSRFVA